METVYHNGCVTASILSKEEAEKYRNMPVGVTVTNDMIHSVAENDDEKQIYEYTANGINRIRVHK